MPWMIDTSFVAKELQISRADEAMLVVCYTDSDWLDLMTGRLHLC